MWQKTEYTNVAKIEYFNVTQKLFVQCRRESELYMSQKQVI